MLSIVLVLVYAVMALPTAAIVFPWTMLSHDTRLLFRAGWGVTAAGLRIVGIRVRVTGRQNVPATVACVFMANHTSNLDPAVLLPATPRGSVIFLKKSLMKLPFLHTLMHLAGFIPVDRTGGVEAAKVSIAAARRALAKGLSLVVFPEGTRSADGHLLPFKKGSFQLAMKAGAPIVPVTIDGTGRLMPKGSLRVRRGEAAVHFHPAVWPAHYPDRESLIVAVREAIASGLPADLR